MDFYSLTHFSGESTQMANIEINELKPAGAELFSDSEGFMNELSDSELDNINGGRFTATWAQNCGSGFTNTWARTCGKQLQAGNGSELLQADNGSGQLEALP
jgi:bacteriocin-like protein